MKCHRCGGFGFEKFYGSVRFFGMALRHMRGIVDQVILEIGTDRSVDIPSVSGDSRSIILGKGSDGRKGLHR